MYPAFFNTEMSKTFMNVRSPMYKNAIYMYVLAIGLDCMNLKNLVPGLKFCAWIGNLAQKTTQFLFLDLRKNTQYCVWIENVLCGIYTSTWLLPVLLLYYQSHLYSVTWMRSALTETSLALVNLHAICACTGRSVMSLNVYDACNIILVLVLHRHVLHEVSDVKNLHDNLPFGVPLAFF